MGGSVVIQERSGQIALLVISLSVLHLTNHDLSTTEPPEPPEPPPEPVNPRHLPQLLTTSVSQPKPSADHHDLQQKSTVLTESLLQEL